MSSLFGGDTPDYSGMNQAAVMSAQLGSKAFDWFSKEYDKTAPDRAKAQENADAVTAAQLKAMDTQTAQAKDYADYNKGTFRPLEQNLVSMAQAYDTPEREQAAADQAVADVNSQVADQRQATQMDLARSGVSPDSMKSQALMASGDINAAKMAAGAAGAARRGVEATGWARMEDAANLGRNLPSAQATAVQTGTNAGNAALGASNASLAAGQSGAGLMSTGFNTALSGQGQAGNIFGQVAGLQNQTRGQDLNFMSSIFGSAMKSDEKIKKNTGQPADTAGMLDAVQKTPVDQGWSYDPAKGGPDDGGAKHDGPMAQDVRKHMGEKAAPGGKVIDLVTMNGITLGAVQELAKKVKKLEQRKGA